ncbi:YigZ family protein [Alkalibacterium sp. MB6]|uniref:YigZ family protein n=1 Tax=Alkalibacterium sp. MB6 TaxID=2081965 RepID=UPI00137A989B|nr:YigZ family protein [Alkalibacterium sp. MB6]
MKNYRTIKQDGQLEINIKKSRFICYLKRTETEEQAQLFIDSLKKEHWKANHNCSAYVIGENNEIQRMSDDGEPSGTAGLPMLDVLKKKDLRNVTAVVTRYFGGVKLGASGLIRAYGNTTKEAIDSVEVVERQLQQYIDLNVSYPMSGKIQNQLYQTSYRLEDTLYTDTVTFKCLVPVEHVPLFYEETTEWTSGQGKYSKGPQAWIEVDVAD